MALVEVNRWHGKILGLFATTDILVDEVLTFYPSTAPTIGVPASDSEYLVEVDIPTPSAAAAVPVMRSKGAKKLTLRVIAKRGVVDGAPIATQYRDPEEINGSEVEVTVFNTSTGEMEPHPLGDALGVYANKSLFANAVLYQPSMKTAQSSDPVLEQRICVVSSTKIVKGAQIFIDYGKDFKSTWLQPAQQFLLRIVRGIIENQDAVITRQEYITTYDLNFYSSVALGFVAHGATVKALHPNGSEGTSVEISGSPGGILAVAIPESPDGECDITFTTTGPPPRLPSDIKAWLATVGNPPSLWVTGAKITAVATFKMGAPPVGFMYIHRKAFTDAAAPR